MMPDVTVETLQLFVIHYLVFTLVADVSDPHQRNWNMHGYYV